MKVDLLIKNNKHIEKKALIISSEGYPAYLKPQLQTIFKRQPNIKIGFLHKPETTIDKQVTCFEQKYQVKLQDKPLWDISANQKYIRNEKLGQTDKSKDDLQTIILPIEETRSENSGSWFSWLIPSTSSVIATNVISAENETDHNYSEIETDNVNGFDSSSDSGDFDSVDDSDGDDGGDDGDE